MRDAERIAEEMRKQEIPKAEGLADFARRVKQILDNAEESWLTSYVPRGAERNSYLWRMLKSTQR